VPPSLSPNLLVGTRDKGTVTPWALTVFDLGSPAPTEDVEWNTVARYNGPGAGWRADSLGSIFGLTLDDFGNIFVTHTSCYDIDTIGQVAGGGPGVIYRIDAITGAIGVFCRLPNYPDPNVAAGQNDPGLGNISYDCRNRQFFVTNLEDGRIYRITANGTNGPTGTIQEVFDPGVQDLGPTNWTVPIGNVPSPGWAPLGERLWGVQWHMDRVYYGVWVEDYGAPSVPLHNEIRSVGLTASGAFNASSDQHELYLPPMPGVDYSMPVSDISFHASGKMLIGERGIAYETYSNPHVARNLEYACEDGCWLPANLYQLGVCCIGANASGGVDYDNFAYTGGALGRVWGTAEAIHLGYPSGAEIFGYQGSRPTGGSNATAVIIDDDGNTLTLDKSFMGDVETPGCLNDDFGQVCGRKFQETNRNGIQDNGETGLPGWPIVLNGPGGPYQLVTDELGYFCFYFLLPGNYTLSEINQQGWIQTAPPGGSYPFTLTAGQSLSGLDFGNYWCAGGSPCIPPPSGMAAWYAFDEAPGTPATADHAHLDAARNALELHGGATIAAPGRVGNALALFGPGAYAEVPFTGQLGLDFESGSFAFDAWLLVSPGAQSPRVIAEKRTLLSEAPYRTRGWALYLDGEQLKLEIGTPEVTETFAGPTVSTGAWTHVAVSVDRTNGTGGAWYLDGVPQPAFGFAPPPGSVFTAADVQVGRRHPALGAGVPFDGLLDELEFFSSPLSTASVASLAAASAGKCREYARVPAVTSICKDKPTVQVCMNIVNNTATAQSYTWSIAGLPAGPGCTVNGPITFSPSQGTVVVPAGGTSAPICVTMTRPAGLTAQNATSCFEFSFVNDATGICFLRSGKIRADNSCWCVTPVAQSVVPVV
ncbi:MAG TPA: LamG-like jellyroll fold domain-containing protein, partial [Arenibaculum sp.]|nr:LamG-like jellyroll fold domain-containing protein [Arenibaculum sp.]